MILDPLNAITSVNFYKKVAGQGVGRTFLYLAYLGLIYSIFSTLWFKMHFLPLQQEAFQWLETNVPSITYSNGRLTTPTNERVTVRHPRLNWVAFTIDTSRTELVAPQMLRDNKVFAYVTANAVYIMQPGGKVEVFDLSKEPSAKPAVIDAKLWRQIDQAVTWVEYPLVLVVCLTTFFFWKIFAALFFSLIASMVNGLAAAGLAYKPLFNISVYAQTLVLALTGIMMIVRGIPPFFHLLVGRLNLISIVVTTVYIWLAVKKNAAAAPQAA